MMLGIFDPVEVWHLKGQVLSGIWCELGRMGQSVGKGVCSRDIDPARMVEHKTRFKIRRREEGVIRSSEKDGGT
jgi:hypothetical protein